MWLCFVGAVHENGEAARPEEEEQEEEEQEESKIGPNAHSTPMKQLRDSHIEISNYLVCAMEHLLQNILYIQY